jgi:hypothetical protein
MDGAMDYEGALRYVFDRCHRSGDPEGYAEADIWRGASMRGDFSKVAYGIKIAIERLIAESGNITWTEDESNAGGLRPNFELGLNTAKEALENGNDIESAYWALASMVHAMKAIILKQIGNYPDEYKSG